MRAVPRWLAAAALPSLVLAWSMGSMPFSGPDEPSHYLRALSIANGVLVGRHVADPNPRLPPAAQSFVDRDATAVDVGAGESPPGVGCLDGRPSASGCVEATPSGDYYPLAYLLPAAVLTVDHHPASAGWAVRVASSLPCIAFLFLAFVALWDGTLLSVLGLLVAVTPMVLFSCSVLNPSGLETSASVGLFAVLVRVARETPVLPRWLWLTAAGAGACTILSWQAGPGFALIDVLVAGALAGRRRMVSLGRKSTREVRRVASVLAAALAVWLLYTELSGVGHAQIRLSPFWRAIQMGFHQLGPMVHGAIGNFGGLTIALPATIVIPWLAIVFGLSVIAVRVADRMELATLAATAAIALLFPVLSFAWIYRQSGFDLQARHVLAVFVLIPMVGGEIVTRHRPRGASVLAGAATVLLALLQGLSWWFNARRSAGTSRLDFVAAATFTPPAGWAVWIGVTILACLVLASAGAVTLRSSRYRVRTH